MFRLKAPLAAVASVKNNRSLILHIPKLCVMAYTYMSHSLTFFSCSTMTFSTKKVVSPLQALKASLRTSHFGANVCIRAATSCNYMNAANKYAFVY